MIVDFFSVWFISGMISVGLLMFVKKKRPLLLFEAVPIIDWRVEFSFIVLFFVFGFVIVPFVLLYLFYWNGRTLVKLVKVKWFKFKNKNLGDRR